MSNDEWWAAVHKAAQYWQEVKDHQIGARGKDISRAADDSPTDSGTLPAQARRNERDTREA